MSRQTIEIRTVVAAPRMGVWARVTSPAGINDELAPFLRMTVPRSFAGRTIADVEPMTHVGRSALRLFGWLPVGHDDITITRIEPGVTFREESAMTGMRVWVHHRTLADVPGGTAVLDQVAFEPGGAMRFLPGGGLATRRILAALFAHRHRRLARWAARADHSR